MDDQPTSTLQRWREAFHDLDGCPWPGPKPLTTSDSAVLLRGRDGDRQTFKRQLDRNRILFLSGSSGVGKTSLLLCGLVPTLRQAGRTVAMCRDWAGSATATSARDYLGDRVRASLEQEEGVTDLPAGARAVSEMAKRFGEHGIIILDQFEELIRDAPRFTDEIFQAIGTINQKSPLKIVISLRSEYLHELRPLEKLVAGYSMDHMYLDTIDPAFALDVITAPLDRVPDAIDAGLDGRGGVAHRVSDWWRRATTDSIGAGRSEVGLLHLQALLYVLHDLASGATVTDDVLDDFVTRAGGEVQGSADRLFHVALQRSVEVKLRRCREAAGADHVDLDPFLVEGAVSALMLMSRHLSSGGYKLVRSAQGLMRSAHPSAEMLLGALAHSRAAGTEVDGPLAEGQYAALFDVMLSSVLGSDADEGQGVIGNSGPPGHPYDLLDATRAELASRADALATGEADVETGPGSSGLGWTERLHVDGEIQLVDPGNTSAGPMTGMSPASVLMEEMRQFVFAIDWLRTASLARVSSPGKDKAMIALVHDRFGSALEEWSNRPLSELLAPIYAISAVRARDLVWPVAADGSPLQVEFGSEGPAKLANLRWTGCFLKASFRDVTFVNCDFRGSFFGGCRFEGVAFVNCLLDGVMFSDCTVIGAPPPQALAEDGVYTRRYRVPGSQVAARGIATYDTSQPFAEEVISDLPGRPAALTAEVDATTGVVPLRLGGGLVLWGGRLSSLSMRSMRFEADGTVALWETAGSGLDVVNHAFPGRFEVVGSAVRHLTFTSSPVDSDLPDGGSRQAPFNLAMDRSAVFQLWIGDGLVGSVHACQCKVVHAWASGAAMKAELQDCAYLDLVGFRVDAACTPIVPGDAPRLRADLEADEQFDVLLAQAREMDYRLNIT